MVKKILRYFLIAIILLCIPSNTIASSDTNNYLKAMQLKQLGLFSGTEKGFELDREPTRIEATVMLVRLLGKEKEALDKHYSHPFTDVPSWADDYVGYMYKYNLTKGIGNNLFGSNNIIQAKSYATLLLRALGYSDINGDFNWNEALEKALEVSIIDEKTLNAFNEKTFLRDDLVGMSHNVLHVKLKDSERTLAKKLVDEKTISSEIAKALGFIKDDVKLTRLTFTDYESDGIPTHLLKIDRSTLPDSMQDFYKVSAKGIGKLDESYFEYSLYDNSRTGREVERINRIKPYSDTDGERISVYEVTALSLYDKENRLIGSAIFEDIKEGCVEVQFKEYQAKLPDDFDEIVNKIKELPKFNDGLIALKKEESRVFYCVDREALPQNLQNYDSWAIVGLDSSIEEELYWIFKKGRHTNTEEIYIQGHFDKEDTYLLILFNNNSIIGYKVIEETDFVSKSEKIVQIEIEIEDNGENLTYSDFNVIRYINGIKDTSYTYSPYSFGIKREEAEECIDQCESENEAKTKVTVIIGPLFMKDSSVRYEVTSDKVKIKNVEIKPY